MESAENLFSITCEICDLSFTSFKSHEQHLKGDNHKKQVEDKNKQSRVRSHDDEDQSLEEKTDYDAQEYTCIICEMMFRGIIPYVQHLNSRPHAKTLLGKKGEDDSKKLEDYSKSEPQDNNDADLSKKMNQIVPEPYGSCFICEKQFNGPEGYAEHMRSKTHAKKKSKRRILKKIKSALSTREENDRCKVGEKESEKFENGGGQEELECKECGKVLIGAVDFAQHLRSKAHAKRQTRNKLLEELKVSELVELEDNSYSSEDQEQLEVLTCEICHKEFCGPVNAKSHFQSKSHKRAVKQKKYLARKSKSVEQSSEINASLTTKEATGHLPVSTDHTEETHLSTKFGSVIAESTEVKPSAPPLFPDDEEYQSHQEHNDQFENKDCDQNQERNSGCTAANDDSKSMNSALPSDPQDSETKNILEENSETTAEETSDISSLKT